MEVAPNPVAPPLQSTLPEVSVVVPTFRRPRPLVEAVQSALAQQGPSIEVLVLDDSPEGSAREPLSEVRDPRLRYLRQERPSGGNPGLVRNTGWPMTRGRYLHFLDDDDIVPPGAYAALIDALEANPGAAMAFGRIEPFGDDPEVLRKQRAYFDLAARRARWCQKVGSRRLFALHLLFKHTPLFTSAALIRRESVEALGGFAPSCLPVEDVDLYVRATRRFGCVWLDRTVLRYRTGAPSIMHNQRGNARIAAAYREIYRRYRREHGVVELRLLQLLSKTVLRWP
jgi:glycosyltransferase involved in cell wall biosynthesis